jgi:hypothetical protein
VYGRFKDPRGHVTRFTVNRWGTEAVVTDALVFARGVSLGDVVAVDVQDDRNVFREVVTPSGHSTLRVVFFDLNAVVDLRAKLRNLGCSSELSHLPNLVALDVPPGMPLATVRKILDIGERARQWEYEEAAIRE